MDLSRVWYCPIRLKYGPRESESESLGIQLFKMGIVLICVEDRGKLGSFGPEAPLSIILADSVVGRFVFPH